MTDEMMSNFSPRAQQVLALARREATRLHHNFISTEHLLLGLVSLGQGTAVNVLYKQGLDLESVRNEVEKQVGVGPEQQISGNVPYTPRVKTVLHLAVEEARALKHTYLGTEHILLGLLREGNGVAAHVLQHFDVDTEITRQEILKELDPITHHFPTLREPATIAVGLVDITRRYDVYCAEPGRTVVYRNALFKRRARLLGKLSLNSGTEFLELEQANGQVIFLSASSVIRFCEPGMEPNSE